ncbi:MAG: 3-deoxy-8-phosphooctulonate synthase, partial [Bacteroidota bacterium]
VDYRNIPIMQSHGVPVVMDCTHALQQPNQTSGVTGGNPQMIGTIAKAAIATGADGLFIETHPDPAKALSDGANMLRLELLKDLLQELIKIRKAVV